jgi:hypothetical protein
MLQGDYKAELNTDNPLGWNGKVASEYAELLEKVRFAQN